MGEIVCASLIAAASGFGIALLQSGDTKYSWDKYHSYVSFSVEYTPFIDEILYKGLDKNTRIERLRLVDGTYVPDIGGFNRYYTKDEELFYYFRLSFLGLEKIRVGDDLTSPEIYLGWFSPFWWGIKIFKEFIDELIKSESGTIRVNHIDISDVSPSVMWMNKICRSPLPHQSSAINKILEYWNSNNDFNINVIINGERGSGKTYTAMLLKKEIERRYKNTSPKLYDNFDPSAIGVDINKIALQHASHRNPVILVVNEIDIVYESVLSAEQNFDPRTQHSRSKQTFNNMLDSIAGVKHVISIFTTEKSYEELNGDERFLSFLRPGRVDLFISMSKENIDIVFHENFDRRFEINDFVLVQ